MNKKALFVHKLLNKLGKVDPKALKGHVQDLAAEQACFSQILDEIEEGVILVRTDGSHALSNQTAKQILNFSDEQASKEKQLKWIRDLSLRSFVWQNIAELKNKTVEDILILEPAEAHLRVTLLPLPEHAEAPVLLIINNLTTQKAPQEWEEKIKRIESLVKLAAGIAHEIGNPLNSLSIHLQILKKRIEELPESHQAPLLESIHTLNEETSRLDKIIRDFLKATRKPPIRFKQDDLNQILEEAIRFMQPELDEKKIKTLFTGDEEIPQFIMDRERLYPAFINLIKNAIEAMPEGGELSITTRFKDKVAEIEFRDAGVGINHEDLPFIFDAYFTTKPEGSGLGLMTVFDALNDHKGRVEAASEIGKGTTFTLLLPIRQPKLQLPEYNAE